MGLKCHKTCKRIEEEKLSKRDQIIKKKKKNPVLRSKVQTLCRFSKKIVHLELLEVCVHCKIYILYTVHRMFGVQC